MTETLERQLQDAAANGDLSRCMRLVAAGVDASAGGSWALVRAAQGGHLEVCRLLLENGANADDRESWALSLAASSGRFAACRLLIAHGAKPTHVSNYIRHQALSAMTAADADVAEAFFPDHDREWVVAAAITAGNQILADGFRGLGRTPRSVPPAS